MRAAWRARALSPFAAENLRNVQEIGMRVRADAPHRPFATRSNRDFVPHAIRFRRLHTTADFRPVSVLPASRAQYIVLVDATYGVLFAMLVAARACGC